MLKSNQFKKTDEIYPEEFNDDDKLKFDELWEQAKIIHSEVYNTDPWIIRLAIIGYIRAGKGMAEPFSNEDLEHLKSQYRLDKREFTTDVSDNDYLYDKDNNPIFKPDSYFFEEVNSNVVSTSNLELTSNKITLG